ncbi:leucine-rich PPR motif-containing protein, mitochondrial-like isoform X2 [Prorops nasuta]|uniref:leucine-rich PPR motif-containing protein, mitochondrial-like isoform X2 n=1 Tax=Prorops nasuta TaxID=863751 RepID=UPI0034CF7288
MSNILQYCKNVRYISKLLYPGCLNNAHRCNSNISEAQMKLPIYRNSLEADYLKYNKEAAYNYDNKVILKVQKNQFLEIKDFEKTLSAMVHLKNLMDEDNVTRMIKGCGKYLAIYPTIERTKILNSLLLFLKRNGYKLEISHYTALIQAHLENNTSLSLENIEADIRSKGIEPNMSLYQKFLQYYCKTKDLNKAMEILLIMKEKNFPLNENIFSTLITGYTNIGDFENAKGIINIMQESHIEPGIETHIAILLSHAKTGNMQKLKNMLNTIELQNLPIKMQHILEIMYTLAENGYEAELEQLLPLLQSGYYGLDELNILSHLVEANYIEPAIKIAQIMMSTEPHNFTILKHIMGIFVNNKLPMEKVINICTSFKNEQMRKIALLSSIYHSYPFGNINYILELLYNYKKIGGEIRPCYFMPIFAQFNRESDKIKDILGLVEVMKKDFNILPNSETLEMYIIPKKVEVQELREELRQLGVPTVEFDNAFVNRLLFHKDIISSVEYIKKYPTKYFYEKLRINLLHALCKLQTQQQLEGIMSITDFLYDKNGKISKEIVYKEFIDMQPLLMKQMEKLLNKKHYKSTQRLEDQAVAQLKQLLKDKERLGIPLNPTKIELLHLYIKKNYKNELIKLLEENENNEEIITTMAPRILRYFCEHNYVLEKDKFLSNNMVKLSLAKCYINLLVSNLENNYISMIDTYKQIQAEVIDKNLFSINDLEQMLSANCSPSSSVYKEVQILLQLYSKDISKALENFQNLSMAVYTQSVNFRNYYFIRKQITKYLILTKDAENLQKLINSYSEIVGLQNALADLGLDLLENNLSREAMKIFQRSKLNLKSTGWKQRIKSLIIKKEERILERLLDVVKQLVPENQIIIYESLLAIYDANNNWSKGLQLLIRMQDDCIAPTMMIYDRLYALLNRNNKMVEAKNLNLFNEKFVSHTENLSNISNLENKEGHRSIIAEDALIHA